MIVNKYGGDTINFKNILKVIKRLFVHGKVNYIQGKENLLPPLSSKEEEEHLLRYSKGDIESRNILIEHNLRLVVYVAKRYETNITNLEDLISIGTVGLIKAINTFNQDKNIKLATYASRCIDNEILMFMRKKSKQKLEVSLDEPLKYDYDGNELLLGDILQDTNLDIESSLEKDESIDQLLKAIDNLSEKEKEIITLRFGLDGKEEKTQKEAADELSISQSYISRLEKKIIKKLYALMKK